MKKQGEGLNAKERLVVAAVSAGDEQGEDGDGAVVAAAAVGGGKGTVTDAEIEKEGHAPMEETVDVAEETQTVAAVAY